MSNPLFDGEGVEFEHLQAFHGAQQRQKLVEAAEAEQKERARHASLPQCPCCGGRLNGQFELCMHCRSRLSWVLGVPCKPGEEKVTELRIRALQKEQDQMRQQAAQKAEVENTQLLWGWFAFISIIVLVTTILLGIYWLAMILGLLWCGVFMNPIMNSIKRLFRQSSRQPSAQPSPYTFKCRHCGYKSRDEESIYDCPRCGRK